MRIGDWETLIGVITGPTGLLIAVRFYFRDRIRIAAILSLVLFGFPLHHASGADIIDKFPFIYITGKIELADIKQMEAILGKGRSSTIIRVDSGGGSVAAAMAIGRLIRKNELMVNVGDRCASACIFVLAGGVDRVVEGNVIIHRPFLVEDLPGRAGYDDNYKRTEQLVRSYFAEMNVPVALADRVLAVPPSRQEILTTTELNRYLLNQKDPAYEQKQSALEASRLAISLSEQRRRQTLQEAVCGWPYTTSEDNFFEIASHLVCKDAIMKGENPDKVRRNVRVALQRRTAIELLPQNAQEACIEMFILGTPPNGCPLR